MAVIDENAAWVCRQEIFQEIEIERRRQDELWGPDFDDQNTVNDWVTYIGIYLSRAASMDRATKILDMGAVSRNLLKAITIGVAALETIKRNGILALRHYDRVDYHPQPEGEPDVNDPNWPGRMIDDEGEK